VLHDKAESPENILGSEATNEDEDAAQHNVESAENVPTTKSTYVQVTEAKSNGKVLCEDF
jgi:hypothetical protein